MKLPNVSHRWRVLVEPWAESLDGKFHHIPVVIVFVKPFVDDSGCHGKLSGSPNNSPLAVLNDYSHHLQSRPLEPGSPMEVKTINYESIKGLIQKVAALGHRALVFLPKQKNMVIPACRYLPSSNTRRKELCQFPALMCRPCARATSLASGPGPSYTVQLLAASSPITGGGFRSDAWITLGPRQLLCRYRPRMLMMSSSRCAM
jgi:hypothetical protein